MCLTRKTIYTNAHRLFTNRNTAYEMDIPCGHCSECRKAKANEWRLRTYYEYLDTIQHGGFALWDRLSYDNEHLPHLKGLERGVPEDLDFTCFNRNDIKLFMKRLRSNLSYKKMKAKKNIRYMIAAEYGQEEGRYMSDKGYLREGTLRPHYHMILYCKSDKITPAELSMEIKKAWGKGTTNGIEDNPIYFGDKGVIKGIADAITISDYIGKYCLKNQDYDKVARYKIQEIVRHYIAAEKGVFYEDVKDKELRLKENRDRIAAMIRKVATFHLQSQGYGATALENKKATKHEGKLGMPDKEKTWWEQPMPMYFQRKLYYNYTRSKEGKVTWYLNEKGIDWKLRTLQERIDQAAEKYTVLNEQVTDRNFIDLIRKYNQENAIKLDATEQWRTINDLLFAYRNTRPWRHFAEYILFHKGRIYPGHKMRPEETLRLNARAAIDAETTTEQLYYNYTHTTDKDNFGIRMVGHEDLGDKWKGYKTPYGDEIKPEQFKIIYCTNENTREEWNNYDKLKDIIDQCNTYIEWNDSKTERRRENIKLSWQGQQRTLYQNII